jgi:capsular exopolysaccharide synthesis family protein
METESGRPDVAAEIRNQLRVLREQKWLVLLCIVLTGAAAYLYAQSQRKEYESTAKVLTHQENLTALLEQTGPVSGDPQRQAATDSQLAALPAVGAQASRAIHARRLPDGVSAGPAGDANVIIVDVQDRDPAFAARFANAYAASFIAFRRDSTSRRYTQALRLVKKRVAQIPRRQRNSLQALRLRDQVRQLQLSSSLQTGDAQVVQAASPAAAPFKPRKTRTLIVGLLAGLLLGIALAVLRDKLDRRVKNEAQVRRLLPGVPVIGSIPKRGRGEHAKVQATESFHTLFANVGFASPNGRMRSLLVTSAAPEEGKSTISANLALAMSAHGQSPILLEADLRRPGLSDSLGIDRAQGVSRILVGDGTIASSLQRAPVQVSPNGDGPRLAMDGELAIVPAGPTPPNPQVLLNDRRLEALLAEARAQGDTVIVDGPPMGLFSDMLPVAQRVEGVIVAVRLYHSRRGDLERFRDQLETAGIRPIGVVVMGAALDVPSYYSY